MAARPRVVVLLGLVAMLSASCGSQTETPGVTGPTAEVTTSAPTPTESPEPTETKSPEPTESPDPVAELEDGRHFGDVVSIDVPAQTMRFDLAYFLTGDEANEAAAEHGDEVPVPNDYYIVNDNPRLRTLSVDPNVEVWVIDWGNCCELTRGEIQPFVDAFATDDHAWDDMYQGSGSWYWLTVRDGAVVKIEEQYLP